MLPRWRVKMEQKIGLKQKLVHEPSFFMPNHKFLLKQQDLNVTNLCCLKVCPLSWYDCTCYPYQDEALSVSGSHDETAGWSCFPSRDEVPQQVGGVFDRLGDGNITSDSTSRVRRCYCHYQVWLISHKDFWIILRIHSVLFNQQVMCTCQQILGLWRTRILLVVWK